jgi:hypothetical protein
MARLIIQRTILCLRLKREEFGDVSEPNGLNSVWRLTPYHSYWCQIELGMWTFDGPLTVSNLYIKNSCDQALIIAGEDTSSCSSHLWTPSLFADGYVLRHRGDQALDVSSTCWWFVLKHDIRNSYVWFLFSSKSRWFCFKTWYSELLRVNFGLGYMSMVLF